MKIAFVNACQINVDTICLLCKGESTWPKAYNNVEIYVQDWTLLVL